MANRNFSNGGKMYAMETKPILVSCNFVVDATNGNGLGIRSLKGPLVQNIFMHTSSTPGAGNSNPASPNVVVTNPNPASGYIVIQLQDNYARSLSGFNSIVSPASGSSTKIDNSALTAHVPYIITIVGNSTAADWQAIGLPKGVTPAVGVSFIASAVGVPGEANTSTSRVQAVASAGSTVMSIETIGDPNLSIAPNPTVSQGFGAQILLACRDITGAIAAPAAGSVISLSLYLSDSSVNVQGE